MGMGDGPPRSIDGIGYNPALKRIGTADYHT